MHVFKQKNRILDLTTHCRHATVWCCHILGDRATFKKERLDDAKVLFCFHVVHKVYIMSVIHRQNMRSMFWLTTSLQSRIAKRPWHATSNYPCSQIIWYSWEHTYHTALKITQMCQAGPLSQDDTRQGPRKNQRQCVPKASCKRCDAVQERH
jgi:hypothetical protein